MKDYIKEMLEEGITTRNIASKLKISQSSVQRLRKKCGNTLKTEVGGRPKKLSGTDGRRIIKYLTSGEAKSTANAAKILQRDTGKIVSRWTVQRKLKDQNFQAIEKKKKPLLSKKNIKARLNFAKKYEHYTEEDWRKVIWSDETKINRYTTDGRQWSWKREGEPLTQKDFIQTVKHGGGNIKIWGCFTAFGVGSLQKIDGNMNKIMYLDILKSKLKETIENMPYPINEVIFQQDNDPKHTAKVVKKWLHEQDFKLLEWPAQSPDLNPIENLWALLKKGLANNYDSPPSSLPVLYDRVQEQWYNLSLDLCEKLVKSMSNRLQAVIKAKGLWTKY